MSSALLNFHLRASPAVEGVGGQSAYVSGSSEGVVLAHL